MKNHISQVVTGGIESESFEIEHMCQPCNRVPIGGIRLSESPDYAFAGQSLCHMCVLGDIAVVVKVEELVVDHLPVGQKGYNHEE